MNGSVQQGMSLPQTDFSGLMPTLSLFYYLHYLPDACAFGQYQAGQPESKKRSISVLWNNNIGA